MVFHAFLQCISVENYIFFRTPINKYWTLKQIAFRWDNFTFNKSSKVDVIFLLSRYILHNLVFLGSLKKNELGFFFLFRHVFFLNVRKIIHSEGRFLSVYFCQIFLFLKCHKFDDFADVCQKVHWFPWQSVGQQGSEALGAGANVSIHLYLLKL